jgi:hypothetical protein
VIGDNEEARGPVVLQEQFLRQVVAEEGSGGFEHATTLRRHGKRGERARFPRP